MTRFIAQTESVTHVARKGCICRCTRRRGHAHQTRIPSDSWYDRGLSIWEGLHDVFVLLPRIMQSPRKAVESMISALSFHLFCTITWAGYYQTIPRRDVWRLAVRAVSCRRLVGRDAFGLDSCDNATKDKPNDYIPWDSYLPNSVALRVRTDMLRFFVHKGRVDGTFSLRACDQLLVCVVVQDVFGQPVRRDATLKYLKRGCLTRNRG